MQDELAEQTLKAMCRKFSTSAKVWLRHISWLLAKDRSEAARKVLDRSFSALPQRKHIKVTPLKHSHAPRPAPLLHHGFLLLVMLWIWSCCDVCCVAGLLKRPFDRLLVSSTELHGWV